MPVLVERAGSAAEGMLVTLSAIANERLACAGAEFRERFRRRTSQDPCCYSVHVAQGTHVLLDAIAASDGSREAVTAALPDVRVSDGIIGSFGFDEKRRRHPAAGERPVALSYRLRAASGGTRSHRAASGPQGVVMRFHRINRPLAVALAAGAAMAPAAGAQYQDLRSPDTRDAAQPPRFPQDLRSPDTGDAAEPPRFPQDLRSPDTRDAAAGRGLETAPVVGFVEVPQVSRFDWGDAGLGAAAGFGVLLLGAGGALTTVRMRRRVVA